MLGVPGWTNSQTSKCPKTMHIYILLLTVALATAAENQSDLIVCDGVIFHNVYFDRELLFKDLGRPYNLVMHKFSGILFFSHTIQNGTQVDFGIRACHLEKRTCREILGVPGGYAIAYDAGNDDIYFGGHDGIYKYNFLTKSAEFFAEEGKSIWGLFVRRNFYYIEYPTQKLYVYQDDSFVQVAEAINIEVDHFFVSKHIDVYFSNKTALYKVERPNNEAIVLNDEIVIRQIVEDSYGDVFFCAGDGIYLEDKPYHKVKKVAEIEQAFGMTFDDKDHIIYSDKDKIYRLIPSKYSGLCLNAIINSEDKDRGDIVKKMVIS
ncbi:ommochrome-binding protein-like isoform X1 [Helicoverpa zea]|uniref:ommochrome-binding protein-like isoform X1 n=2 Tax=Helicoverpa zea TaxID=7113 RepID=UPI001F593BB1|nr:ommochrome-binding protein-like isoform X1 [Helicoverpa zea]XP_047036344.1 ommochrome-binding protein-like isoform X1 [Helicoverpa zea]XP_047036345.1 ommochrome-binding protein-like isoform X1 [Helicoverpa zea]